MDNKTKEELIRQGRLKPLSEAFKEYPVEEEIHFGHHEWYMAEKIVKYGKYDEKDIIFIKEYKYEDGSIGRDHLFVIIDKNNTSVPLEYFSFLISSNLSKLKYKTNVLIKKDNINNLKKDSLVKLDVGYIIPHENVINKIGEVTDEQLELYKKLHKQFIEDWKQEEILVFLFKINKNMVKYNYWRW